MLQIIFINNIIESNLSFPHYQGLQILKWECDFPVVLVFCCCLNHRENGGTLGMVPLVINPMYTLYSGNLLGISPFKGLVGGLNS